MIISICVKTPFFNVGICDDNINMWENISGGMNHLLNEKIILKDIACALSSQEKILNNITA